MTPPSSRIAVLAVGMQAGLAALAVGLAQVFGLRFAWGTPWRDAVIGLAAACGVALVNYQLLGRRRVWPPLQAIRDIVDEVLMPLFSRLAPAQIVAVAASAGIAEELLFRGVVQPLAGLVAASLLFGAAHVASRTMLAFGAWATAMGALMGGLAIGTGGLVAPMVAHGVYDLLALAYLRQAAITREDERPLRL